MESLTAALVEVELHVVRFDFEYMVAAKKAGKPRPPSKLAKLVEEFQLRAEEWDRPLYIGGKSLGGRVATHLATEFEVDGVIAFGYPFHPPGKPDKLRTEHLPNLRCPLLICQGERDTFGKRVEVEGYDLPPGLQFCWLPDGDHQFKPPKSSSASQQSNLEAAARATRAFIS